jgi:DNA-binding NtrC family response regulator
MPPHPHDGIFFECHFSASKRQHIWRGFFMARILIAHQEKYLRHTLALILENWGYHTEQVEDGWSALLRILESKNSKRAFDLLVVDVDIAYPRTDRLLKELLRQGASLPTIIISGLFAGETFEEIRDKIPMEILHIPFGDGQIKRSLSRLLS